MLEDAMATASIAELRAALESVLASHFGKACGLVRLERTPSRYQTSFGLEELVVEVDDGTALRVMFKDLCRQSLDGEALRVKPAFLHDPLREIETYRQILAPGRLGTAVCYGAIVDRAAERYWLFLEKVAGRELYQVGELALWTQAARWLAALHGSLACRASQLARQAHLVVYDGDFYRLWPQRALEFLPGTGSSRTAQGRHGLERLARRYDLVVERLLALPATVIHGDFYAANVLVQEQARGLRVCPVDWEMAGLGPGLMDLAALSAGHWTDDQRATLARAYLATLEPAGTGLDGEQTFLEALDYCRLHLAVQYLGWAPGWAPPPAQAQDWLAEALRLAERLGL
jgi:hypothetical protein